MPPPGHAICTILIVDPDAALPTATGTDDRSITATKTSRGYESQFPSQYWLPNDSDESSRLDMQHHIWLLTLCGSLYLTPLNPDRVQNVLDVGTGTGQWAIEFAHQFPNARVLGMDLSSTQLRASEALWKSKPPNVEFVVHNAESDWTLAGYPKFDFVHGRLLTYGIHDWPKYFERAWDILEPGGWIENLEPDFPPNVADENGDASEIPQGVSAFVDYFVSVAEAATKIGINTRSAQRFRNILQKQGFVNIKEERVKWPIGTWVKGNVEKRVGLWTRENTKSFIGGIGELLIKVLGWDRPRLEEMLAKVKEDLDDTTKRYYWQMYVFSAQKPE